MIKFTLISLTCILILILVLIITSYTSAKRRIVMDLEKFGKPYKCNIKFQSWNCYNWSYGFINIRYYDDANIYNLNNIQYKKGAVWKLSTFSVYETMILYSELKKVGNKNNFNNNNIPNDSAEDF